MNKVIVAHPSKQHSLHTAMAIESKNMLHSYITTIYQKKGTIISLFIHIIPSKYRKKVSSHYCEDLPIDKIIVIDEFLSLLYLFISRIKGLRYLSKWLYLYLVNSFGVKVADYAIKNNVDAVIMYDETSVSCFKILKEKAPKIKRILDVSTVNRLFVKRIYEEDMLKYHHDLLRKRFSFLWKKKNIKYYHEEIELTDFFIFPSNFVMNSYKYSNSKMKNYKIIPYGVDATLFKGKSVFKYDYEKIKLIFVGQISLYKGLHHLLSVISQIDSNKVELSLVGPIVDYALYVKYRSYKHIHFEGFVPFAQLQEYYHNADVFVFPTLGEGFGLVVLEALSCGLPVICSQNAGGNDCIKDGYNGFVYNPLNEEELRYKIIWFIENKCQLRQMSVNAQKSVQYYTWEKYSISVSEYVREIIYE